MTQGSSRGRAPRRATLLRRLRSSVPAPVARALYPAHRAAATVADAVSAARSAPTAPPLLSVIVPVYGVERYLTECLDSVLGQTYEKLEVVVVDDGSPDRSYEIASAYADRDPRVRILRQANAGLGAARNTGAAAATGSYLTFLDSDDTLEPRAYELLIGALERSGSDFAVSCYRRWDASRRWSAAGWIRAAHARDRLGITLSQHPDVLVNAVAWSKVYRRTFWVEQGFRFPHGVLYEDQALSASAYAAARQFDVLAAVTHNWRVRENASSISQQLHDPIDLRARFAAAFDSLEQLHRLAPDGIWQARLVQLLSNDFPVSVGQAPGAGDEFWDVLVDGLTRLSAMAGDDIWPRVSVGGRALTALVTAGRRADVVAFLDAGGRNLKTVPTTARHGQVVALLPLPDAMPEEERTRLGALTEAQTGLVTRLGTMRWTDEGRLDLRGWAYADNVDHARDDTCVRVRLRGPSGRTLDLAVEQLPDPDVSALSKHQWCNYERSCFRVLLDPVVLRAELAVSGRASQRWIFEVETAVAGLVRRGPLLGVDGRGSAGAPLAQVDVDGVRVLPESSPRRGLVIDVRRLRLRAASVAPEGDGLRVHLDRATCGRVTGLVLTADGVEPVRVTVRHGGAGPQALVRLPDGGAVGRRAWTLRAIEGRRERRSPVAWPPDDPGGRLVSLDGRLSAVRSRDGNLTLVEHDDLVVVEDAAFEEGTLRIDVRLLGRATSAPEMVLNSHLSEVVPLSTTATGGLLRLVLPLEVDRWGLGPAPLPSAAHAFVARRALDTGEEDAPEPQSAADDLASSDLARGDSGGQEAADPDDPSLSTRDTGEVEPQDLSTVAQEVAQPLLQRLPLRIELPGLRGRLERDPQGHLRLLVMPPLADDERGARAQRVLRELHAEGAATPQRAVVFRSYYGEEASDSALAVHEELGRRGSDITRYWAVRDHSVHVPEGGVAVVHESRRWYELLRDARYVVDNMHQPMYFRKRAHHVVVQTFHGYPFKEMGHPHWQRLGFSAARRDSFDARARQWDYLVSPASYATPLLARDFRYDGPMLEIGYPRNDVLLSPRAHDVRERTRALLGLRPDQTVVLYAPTFRDSMSTDDFSASMVSFLDPAAVVSALPDHVLLVRGHAFNARVPRRLQSRHGVRDVTDYPLVSNLYLAADVLVADYSSLRFDFALTRKPMLFLVPDKDTYRDEARGWLFDFGLSAPGPKLSSTAEVIAWLSDLDRKYEDYRPDYDRFLDDFCDLEDGHASARFVDEVMASRGDAPSSAQEVTPAHRAPPP